MTFFTQQYSFTVSGVTLFTGGTLLLIGAISVLIMLMFLVKKVRTLETPKYGFLGKPVYTLSTILLLGLMIYFVGYNFTLPDTFDIKAKKTLTEQLVTNKLNDNTYETTVEFKLLPTVDQQVWGKPGSKFDFYWNVTGPMKFDEFELNKSAADPSGFQKLLKKGRYTINILIVFENETYNYSEVRDL